MPDPTPTTPVPAAHDAVSEPQLVEAAQRVLAEVDALRNDDIEMFNRDLGTVVTTVLGANRQIQPYVPQLASLAGIDIDSIRKLGDYAQALLYWSSTSTYAKAPKPEVAAMVERAILIRERTIHDLRSLSRHGLIAPSLLENFGETSAHRKVAQDLIGLSALVHEHWKAIEGKTPITLAAMDDALRLGQEIMQAIGDRDVAEAEKARDVVRRNKAYTLVLNAYEEARHGLAFLRRSEGDMEKIAPSIFAFQGTSKRKSDASTQSTSATPAPGATTDALGPKTSSLIVPDNAST